MKKHISLLLAVLMLVSCFAFNVAAADDADDVTLRIEGITDNFYDDIVEIELTDDTTVADVVIAADAADDELNVTFVESKYGNYISEINGDKEAKFGGYDGWQYRVNGEDPGVGVTGCKVRAGDEIVLYYGGFPCQFPVADFSEVKDGKITVKSYDSSYDENWNVSYDWVPVADAKVTLDDDSYTTDENGVVTFNYSDYEDFVIVQIEKNDKSGAPAVCRFAADYGFEAEPSAEETTGAPETTAPATTEPAETTVPETTAPATTEPAETTVPETTAPATTEPAETTTPEATAPATTELVETTAPETTAPVETTVATEATTAATQPVTIPSLFSTTVKKTLYTKATFTIKAEKAKFKSSDKTVAKVNKNGKVTALKKGKATITATSGSVVIKYRVTVKNPSLKKKSATIKKGSKYTIKYNGSGKVTFTAKNKKIVKVSKKGVITAKKVGNTTVTVKLNGKKLKFTVKVKKK